MAEKPKPRRRWFQFSLKTIFLLVTVVAVPCGLFKWKWDKKQAERRAVAAIRGMNGDVGYDWQDKGGKGTPPGPAWLRAILGDDWFAHVTNVSISLHRDLLGGDLDQWRAVKHLRTFWIQGSKLVRDAGLEFLTGLNEIERLSLDNMPLTDAGMSSIKEMHRLSELELDSTDITDDGLAILRHLPALETLSLEGCGITDSGLAHLSSLSALRQLDLSSTPITDAGLVHLTKLNGLTYLRLAYTDQVSFEGMVELRKALPNCKIRDR